jgi:DNA-binding transcriptional LysR family regulator
VRFPEVSVDLLLIDRAVRQVEEGIDIAIRLGPLEDPALIARRLGAFQRIVCAAPTYLRRRGEPRAPQDLEQHDCLVNSVTDAAGLWGFDTAQGEPQIPVKGRLYTNDIEVNLVAALGGAGLVLTPSWLAQDHILAGRLVQVLKGFELPARPVHALFPHLRLLSTKVRAFMDFVAERCVIGEPPDSGPPGM